MSRRLLPDVVSARARALAFAALTLVSWSPVGAAAPNGPCPALPGLADLACVARDEGWFYADDAASAARLADDARIAADTFVRHFERTAPPGAVVAAGTGRHLGDDARTAMRDAGARWVLPWLDASERATLRRDAIERQLRARLPDADDARIRSLREAALAQAANTTDAGGDGADTDRSALRHEIGHMLLIDAFWPDRAVSGAPAHYGGPGPDWLDETAGVLMESEAMTAVRRRLLYDDGAMSQLRPLDEFFAMPHPLMAGLVAARAEADGPPHAGIRVVSGDAGRRMADQALWFYVQARGVADFLIARAGTPTVFAGIARFVAGGGDIEDWLALHGPDHGLPPTVAALDAAWRAWHAASTPH